MSNQIRAEWYKLRHSMMPLIILAVCAFLVLLSFAFGEMTFFGAGDSITSSIIGFQAKCYLSEATPTFHGVARSTLAYTAFFWVVGVLFTALFFIKEYSAGTIKLPVAYGTNRIVLYCAKILTIFATSLLVYFGFIAVFFAIETVQSGYFTTGTELVNMLGWTLICGMTLLALESITIFLCVLIQNTGIVTGIICLYVFSGASVYLMQWSDMEAASLPLKLFIYCNPMYYWMNFSSCRTMGIVEHLPYYVGGGLVLLVLGGFMMSRKEIK